MLRDKQTAKEISELMVEFGGRLDVSVSRVQETCSDEEFRTYRRAVAKIMGEMLTEVMNPLYAEHPDIKPPELD